MGTRNIRTGRNSGQLEKTDGTTVEWTHDGGRDIEIKPSRELSELETAIVMEQIDGTEVEMELVESVVTESGETGRFTLSDDDPMTMANY